MLDDKKYDTPQGKIFLNKYKDQWIHERQMIYDDAEKIIEVGLMKIREEFENEDNFEKMLEIYVKVWKHVYTIKIVNHCKKYDDIFMSL